MLAFFRRASTGWLFPAFSLLTLALFGPFINGWFQEDDYVLLLGVRDGGPFGMWSHAPSDFFRPLTSLSIWGQFELFGLNPGPYRVFSALVYAGVATALALLVEEISANSAGEVWAKRIARAAGTLFVVAPNHSETLFWISARTDLLATLFALISLWFAVRYVHNDRPADLAGSVVSFGFGLLCKESILLVPAMAVAYAILRGNKKSAMRLCAPLLGVVVLYVFARVLLIGSDFGGGLTRGAGFKAIGATLVLLIRCILPGVPLGDSGINNTDALSDVGALAYIVGGLAIVVTTYLRSRSRSEGCRFLWISLGLALLPAVGLSVRIFRSQGERFVFLPSAFLIALVAVCLIGPDRDPEATISFRRRGWIFALATVGSLLFVWQRRIWIQGAEISQSVQSSFVSDIVREVGPEVERVAILDLPTGVQGAYGVVNCPEALAPLFARRSLKVNVLSAFTPLSREYRLRADRDKDTVRISTVSPTKFSLDATRTVQNQISGPLRGIDLVQFGAWEVRIDLAKIPPEEPVYYWDGTHFIRVLRATERVRRYTRQ